MLSCRLEIESLLPKTHFVVWPQEPNEAFVFSVLVLQRVKN